MKNRHHAGQRQANLPDLQVLGTFLEVHAWCRHRLSLDLIFVIWLFSLLILPGLN
jgi:hypothetical protein